MTYIKDYISWATKKTFLDGINEERIPYFGEREIWYCSMGCNVGYEQDGKGAEFLRPVLIIKKYNGHIFTGIPLTSKTKAGPFYFPLGTIGERNAMAILSQTKAYSSKRLINKMGMLDEKIYIDTKKAASDFIFSS